MPWLTARVRALGAAVEQADVSDLSLAGGPGGPPRVVVNCSGLGARELARDTSVFASRGQLVHLAPVPLERFTLDEALRGSITYVIPRADAVVLGGTVEDHVETLEPSPEATRAIVARACRIEPRLAGLPVRAVTVGLRPCRSVVRLEAEPRPGGLTVVHNYGHGGAGFTLSWGAAEEAAALVVDALAGR
jgi:D-amino-acid oxidase